MKGDVPFIAHGIHRAMDIYNIKRLADMRNPYCHQEDYEVTETDNAVKVHADKPHLVSLGSGRLSTAVTILPLQEGRTDIGTALAPILPDVIIQGTGVEDEHCYIDNIHGVITLYPVAKMCSVDGVFITEPTRLRQGCMLCLGRSNYFRFNHPKEAKKIKDALPNCRISCAPLNFLQELEENPEYLQMISDAAANVKKRSSSGSDRGQGRGSSGSDRGGQGRGSSGSDRGQGRGSSGSDKGYSKSLRSPNMVFNESQEDEEFLNKVSKFELLSRSRTSPTARSPTNKSFSPDGSYKGSYGAGAVSSDYRPHHTPEQSSSPSAYQYAGEKLFTKETATMRVSADFLKKTGKINEERTPSTASTSSSSLTSVSSTGGATLSWHSDSPDVVKSSKGHANSDMSSSHSGGIYTSTPKSTETRKEFVTLKSPTTPYKAPIVKVDSVNTKLAMTLDAEKLAESIMNGDLLTPYVGDDNDDKSSHRNTFEGMDFDFNELTASQQDLTLRHREIVAERKKEQEMEKLEKQRLEEILSMCAEYEEQITNPSTGQKVKVGDAGKQEHKPPWSMAQFLENNVPRNKTTPPMASVVQGEQLLRGNNALDSVPTFSSSDVSDSSYSVSASYLPLRNGASDSKDTHKNENGYNSGNSEIHSMAPGYHIYENSREIKEEQIPQREVRNYKEVFYHRNGIDNLQALQDQWRPNVLYSQEGQITSSTNQSSPKHKISPNSSFEKQNSPRGNSTPEKSPKEKKSPKFGVQVMFGNEFPKLSPSQHKVSEDLHSKKDNSHYLHSNIKEDNSKIPVKKDNSHCYAEVDIDKEIENVHGSTVPDKPTVNLSLKLQNDADAVQTSTSHTQRPLQLPSFQDFSSEVNSLDRKEKSERRSSGNTMSKIKTNGSLTMISSPSNPHKDFTMGFQMRRASSNSSNSEEESTSNSEDTGTIKRRPLMEMTKRRGSSSSNEGNSGKDNRMHSPEELSSCPKFSPAMGSRSPKLTRRKVYKEEVSKLSADSDGGSVSDKCINDSEKFKRGEFASRITDGCDVSVRLNGNDSALVPADYCSPEITVSNSSHNSDAGDTSWSSINSSQSGIYENIPARAAKPFKVEVKQGLKLPALVHTDISTSSLESSGKPSRSSSGSSCSKRSDDADNTTPMNSDGEITLARKRQTDRKSTGSDRSYKLREDSDSHQQLDRLKKSKQELQNRIVSLKHQITEIETQENEAIRELEMERALLEGEHQTELVELQRDKDNITALKSQQKILVDRYTQDREMELQQIDIEQQKLAELEERHLETEQLLETCSKAEEVAFLEQYHRQLEMIDGQRKILDDLEFKQLESEAKYEEEKEQLQRQLMVEQQELLTKYKSREDRLHQIDSQQDQMISGLKQDMHSLEHRRQNLVEEFRKEKAELSQIIKQIQETSKQLSISISEDLHKELSVDDLQEEKQKEELSRLPNSSEQDVLPATPKTPASIKNWVMTPDSKVTSTDLCVPEKGERKKSLTMLEIEKNHSLFLEQQGGQVIEQERRRIEELKRRAADEGRAQWEERKLREANCKSFNSLESEDSSIASSCETPSEKEHSLSSGDDQLEKLMELERLLAQAQQEKMKIIEDQVKFREKEMIELQEERQKREELERKLREETQLREELVQQQIKMRDRQTKQARPLTRYLPVRGKEFNLKQHIETAGHHLDDCHHVIVTPTSCRGWLNKMGNKFKTWHRRWFVFDRVKRSFIYYSEKNESKARGGIYFQAIEEVYVDHLRTVKSPNTKLTFCVKTADRTYYMVAPTAEAMRIWIDVIITGAEGYQEFL